MKESVREFLRTDFTKASGLDLNILQKGTDEYRAVMDAVYLAGKRQSIFWFALGSSYIDGGFGFRYSNYVLSQSEGINLKLDGEEAEYKNVFKPVNEWLSRGIFDDGIATGGQRFRFVCDSLGEDWDTIMKGNELPMIRQAGQGKV